MASQGHVGEYDSEVDIIAQSKELINGLIQDSSFAPSYRYHFEKGLYFI